MKHAQVSLSGGFTLIEVVLASVAAALILAAVYGVFQHALNLRDSDTQRTADSRARLRVSKIIRNDLRNAYVSGGLFASTIIGDAAGTNGGNSGFPGYLDITTTTGKDTDDNLYGDVQQVEYYIVSSTTGDEVNGGGDLVRTVTRDLLDQQPQPQQQEIMPGVQSMQVAFYDGTNWQTSWDYETSGSSSAATTGSTSSSGSSGATLPVAIRVDIQQVAPTAKDTPPPQIEVLVPFTTQPFYSPTPAPSASPS